MGRRAIHSATHVINKFGLPIKPLGGQVLNDFAAFLCCRRR
jgi:hypothetical protein